MRLGSFINIFPSIAPTPSKTPPISPPFDEEGETSLTRAISSVEKELSKEYVNINTPNTNQLSPLILAIDQAVKNDNTDIIDLLLIDDRIDGNALDADGESAMNHAVGNPVILSMLVDSEKCDPNIGEITPLDRAVANGKIESIRILLKIKNIDPNIKSFPNKKTPLDLAVNRFDKTNSLENKRILELIFNDPRINTQEKDLQQYCRRGPEFEHVNTWLEKNCGSPIFHNTLPAVAGACKIGGGLTLKPTEKKKRHIIHLPSFRTAKNSNPQSPKPVSIELAPYTARFFFNNISESLSKYSPQRTCREEALQIEAIATAIKAAALPRDENDTLSEIKDNKLTFIESGFGTSDQVGHAVITFFWDKYFVLCNKGVLSRKPIEVYEYDSNALTSKVIHRIANAEHENKKSYKKLFFKELPNELKFKSTSITKELESSCSLPPQFVGNCCWESSETAIYASFMLSSLLDTTTQKNSLKETKTNRRVVKKIMKKEDKVFWSWLALHQITEIGNFIKYREELKDYTIPNKFICKAFCNAKVTAARTHDAEISKKLSKVKKEFQQNQTTFQKITFKIQSFVRKIFLKLKIAIISHLDRQDQRITYIRQKILLRSFSFVKKSVKRTYKILSGALIGRVLPTYL